MAEIKTKETNKNVYEFIENYVDNDIKKQDSYKLIELMKDISKSEAKMWGDTMIGFSKYHYKSERSKQEGDWFKIGFSPRKTAITVYVYSYLENYEDLLLNLGKFKMGKGCIYIKKLSDINIDVLSEILKKSMESNGY